MSSAKNIILFFLSFFLIIFLSLSILSLTLTLTVNEKSLNYLIRNYFEPFVEEQIEKGYANLTQQDIQSIHLTALYVCQNSESYEVIRRGENVISLKCDKVRGTNALDFFKNLKSSIKSDVVSQTESVLDRSKQTFQYIYISFWVFLVLSFFLIIIIILIAGKFPYKLFGAVGLISGSIAIVLLFLKFYLQDIIQKEIQKNIPLEMLNSLSASILTKGIMEIFSSFIFTLIVAFGILFLLGSILLTIGIFVSGKEQKKFQPNQTLPPRFQTNQQKF